PDGDFSFSYTIPWGHSVGPFSYLVEFIQPSAIFESAATSLEAIDVYDIVTITLDTQTVSAVTRGDTITVTGYVTDGGGTVENVQLELLLNSIGLGIIRSSIAEGVFEFEVDTATWNSGSHNFSVISDSIYYELGGATGYWMIDIYIISQTTVIFETLLDVMPGETFTISYTVTDDDGVVQIGADVDIYLGDTWIQSDTVRATNSSDLTLMVPTNWLDGTGYFSVEVRFSAVGYIESSSGETTDLIHIFVDADISSPYPTQTAPNQGFTISGILLDDTDQPIVGRDVRINLQNESRVVDATTDSEGRFEYTITQGYPDNSRYYYVVTFRDSGNTIIDRKEYTILIQSGFPPEVDTMLLIIWVAAIVIEIVIAMLLVARFRYSRIGFSRFRSRSSIDLGATKSYSLIIR
ncbi:MAG: hypothetical protein ACTSU3_04850, partial [Candidatus Thorarchaeota archaeon]